MPPDNSVIYRIIDYHKKIASAMVRAAPRRLSFRFYMFLHSKSGSIWKRQIFMSRNTGRTEGQH